MMPCTNEQIARVMYAAVAQHYYLNGDKNPHKGCLFDTLDEAEQAKWINLAGHLRDNINKEGPEGTWNYVRDRGLTSARNIERSFDMLPDSLQERVFLIRGIVTSLTGWNDERRVPTKVGELRW